VIRTIGGLSMTGFVGLDVSQKMTAICVVDKLAADYGGASAPQIQNKSACWSAGMQGMTPALG
jgi:hypothetical protein